MKPLKVKVSITLDNDIVKELKELAEKDDRSFSQYINILLRKHLENFRDSV
ncbi:MAG: ribbon-helix-helix domain-containing protein [Clostridia bacterium]|jgi:predicted transcriptional regulator|nr:ribbon-helix-helix domain-containing protein [Clostridia bacterium]MCI1958883.1 ribbon-helix-helix domain-containing protein [Clostridia bacterium]MCI1999371.1 ribbon-helix-helix domain-containing protein [Clostridia bacterium]MCI2015127.1 ribbon-helix-helix domain-containing protein [Clostridia bacterium]